MRKMNNNMAGLQAQLKKKVVFDKTRKTKLKIFVIGLLMALFMLHWATVEWQLLNRNDKELNKLEHIQKDMLEDLRYRKHGR